MDTREIDINQVALPQLADRAAEVSQAVRGDTKLTLVEEPQERLQVDQVAHRRWRGNFAVDFISRVDSVEIHNSRQLADGTESYILEVSLRGDPMFVVERAFSDFQDLRESVLSAFKQPRSAIKLITGTEKRKEILSQFMNDFIIMGKRRVQKIGKAKCGAQTLVPLHLEEFLCDVSKTSF